MILHSWAKLDGLHGLPLADHAVDVSAVFQALLDAGWGRRFGRGISRPLSSQEKAAFGIAAYLHDMGKANAGFWRRQDPAAPMVGHLLQLLPLGCRDLNDRLQPILSMLGEDLFLAMLAHHGRPLDLGKRSGEHARYWKPHDDYRPLAELDALIERARLLHPAADDTAADLSPRTVALFAGLLTLADWIGSSAERFPLDGVTGPVREARSFRVARDAVRRLGLDDGSHLRDALAGTFEQAFGFEPHDFQAAAGVDGDRLTILEAETGSGKTEAALWRFLRLFAAGEVDSLYFALPTRTSAVQMHDRIEHFLGRAFGPDAPETTLAVPGYLRVGDVTGTRLTRWDVLWPDDPSDAGRDARWASESAKQFLAARVGVGTVDQALLSGLRVRHAHLRAACLSRSLLVVDEVHASDAYMTEVLAQVLDNHLGAGGHAMLLSATLGAAARTRLTLGRHAAPPPLAQAEHLAYPALHGVANAAISPRADKRVRLEREGFIDDAVAMAQRAANAARDGARVLVIRNTVAGAVAVQQSLEALGAPIWAVGSAPALHHGRFAAEDRERLDKGIEAAFGKRRSSGGLVAVGTQTLEISLDLDADLMITDLAPMDVLLQRIGRLHRHPRARPAGYDTARAIVATPVARDLSVFLGKMPRRHGLGPSGDTMGGVYPDLAMLEATWAELQTREVLRLPSDNRVLVERALHPEALDRVVAAQGWGTFDAKRLGARSADIRLARDNALDMSVPFSELAPFPAAEENIATRLGARDLMYRLPEDTPGAFGPVTAIRVPSWLAADVLPDAEPQIEPQEAGFALDLPAKQGSVSLIYDRWGLRRAD